MRKAFCFLLASMLWVFSGGLLSADVAVSPASPSSGLVAAPDFKISDSAMSGTTWKWIIYPSLPWKNPGGDWMDKNDLLQGTAPWGSAGLSNKGQEQQLNFNVTDLVKRHLAADTSRLPNQGWIVKHEAGIAVGLYYGREHFDRSKAPRLNVVTSTGIFNLPVIADAWISRSTYSPRLSLSSTMEIDYRSNRIVLLFDLSNLTGVVKSATLTLTSTKEQYTGPWSVLGVYPVAQKVPEKIINPPVVDTAAPSVPTGLAAANIVQTALSLNWSASQDNTAVAGYRIFRNGAQIADVAGVFWGDTNLLAGQTYSYAVLAYDAAGNKSALSHGISVSTKQSSEVVPPVDKFKFQTGVATHLLRYDPPQLVGCGEYAWRITDYSRFTYDSKNHQILMFGGGHSSIPRTDVDVLNLEDFTWKSAYPTTPVVDLVDANFDSTIGGWKSSGHPSSRHTYDLMPFAENTGELILLEKSDRGANCQRADTSAVGKVWHYQPNLKKWSIGGEILGTYEYGAAEYDPISGQIVMVSTYGLYIYDPVSRKNVKVKNFARGELYYAQNLVYFPPNKKMYYILNNGTVFEVTLDRSNFANTTITKMEGITGPLPQRVLPIGDDSGETGWAYDSKNKIIGGGVTNGVFYAFDPVAKIWIAKVMQKTVDFPVGGGFAHTIDYDPVNNIFIFFAGYIPGQYSAPIVNTWAYRYGDGNDEANPPPATVNITLAANPSQVAYKGTAVILWSANNSISCTTPWGATTTSGSYTTPPLTDDTVYTVMCSGATGIKSASVKVVVGENSVPVPVATLVGPNSGTVGMASGNFTISLSGTIDKTVVFDLSDGGQGGTFVPSSVFLTQFSASKTFTYTAVSPGSKTISVTNNGAIPNPAPVTFNAVDITQKVPPLMSFYRNGQPYLFSSVATPSIASRLAGGKDAYLGGVGPQNLYVDFGTGWPWDNPGGDWIDATRTRMGSTPWASVATNLGSSQFQGAAYSVSVTKALQYVQTTGRWNAWIARSMSAPRVIAGKFNNTPEKRPHISVVYTDSTTANLACRVSAFVGRGSNEPYQIAEALQLPVAFEFERPAKPVQSATLYFYITEHWSGGNGNVSFDLADPPVNNDPLVWGIAHAYSLDAGLSRHPSVIGQHRYQDGSVASDFIAPGFNYDDRIAYSPHLWGGGQADVTKYPYKDNGKWLWGVSQNFNIVGSNYNQEGFVPLAPGLGALRVHMPAATEQGTSNPIVDGSQVGVSGTLGTSAKIFMPEDKFGRLSEIYVRYYVRIGEPYAPTLADRKQVNSDGNIKWTDMAGKFLINAAHKTRYGGNSGWAGGGDGWSLRHEFGDSLNDTDGPSPANGGYGMGFSWYDYFYNYYDPKTNPWGQPAGYNANHMSRFEAEPGQRGGLGSVLYKGRWYCIEMHMKLNSVNEVNAQDGRFWKPDGLVEMWIDGRLAYRYSGAVFRVLPLHPVELTTSLMPPVRELGVAELWFNWYHGGLTRNTIDRTLFITGLVYGTSYIGPMKLNEN